MRDRNNLRNRPYSILRAGLLTGGLLAFSASVSAQLFTDNFSSIAQDGRPGDSWMVIGPDDDGYWFKDQAGLNTGNLDNYRPGFSFAFVNTPASKNWSDVKVSATVQVLQSEGSVALAARYKDNSNYYYAYIKSSPRTDGAAGTLRSAEIFKMANAFPRPIASKSDVQLPNFESSGKSHLIEFEAVGDKLNLYFDGVLVLSATDTELTNGSVGVGASFSQVVFEKVDVTAASASTSSAATSGADGIWRIRVVSNQQKSVAEEQRQNYLASYEDVDVVEAGGIFIVYMGRYATREEADKVFQNLQLNEGLLLEGIDKIESKGELFRVMAGSFPNRMAADKFRDEVELATGIFLVDVEQVGSEYRVLMGYEYTNKAEAESFVAEIKGAVPTASVVALSNEAADLVLPSNVNLTEKDRREAQELIDRMNRSLAPDDRRKLDDDFKRATEQQREVIRLAQQERELKQQRETLSREASNLIGQRKFKEAEGVLLRLKDIDPDNSLVDMNIASVRKELASAAVTPAATPAPTPVTVDPAVRLAQMKENAQKAENSGEVDEALRLWQQIKQDWQDDENLRREADDQIIRLSAVKSDKMKGESKSGSGNLLYIILGVVVAAIVAAVVVLKKKKKPVPAQPLAGGLKVGGALSGLGGSTPLPLGGTTPLPFQTPLPTRGGTPMPPTGSTPLPPTGQTPLPVGGTPLPPPPKGGTPIPQIQQRVAPPTPAKPVIATDTERIGWGMVAPAPGEKGAGNTPMPPRGSTPVPGSASTPIPGSQAATPIPQTSPLTPVPGSSSDGIPMIPDTAPQLFQSPPSGVYQVTADEFYSQDFDGEDVGATPKNWRGSYPNASLTIAEREGGGKCMKFQKTSGNGSAYYSCRFPDAGGRVIVEFDMRCDDKNKYLLGFYIEKDEDFRHSVHAVVHKDTSKTEKISLRLQNESSPYQLGEWVRVKFLIDLPRHLVDGYVNDKPVAIGVRLVSRPKVVNTLSIRDNNNTEGILMIDNIRITRDR